MPTELEMTPKVTNPAGEAIPLDDLEIGFAQHPMPSRYYRLFWVDQVRDMAWLCGANTQRFFQVEGELGVIAAGEALAAELGLPFRDEPLEEVGRGD